MRMTMALVYKTYKVIGDLSNLEIDTVDEWVELGATYGDTDMIVTAT